MIHFRSPLQLACLSLALAVCSPVHAQSKKELAAKLAQAQVTDAEGLARMMAAQAMQPVLQAVSRALGNIQPERREALVKDAESELRKTGQDIEQDLVQRARKLGPGTFAAIYEEKMTEEELRQTLAWLESSASRKLRTIGPEVQNALAQKMGAEAKANVDTKLKSLDDKMRKLFGMPAAPAAAASAKN